MSQNNKFDDLIKNKALNFDADVPADMWDRIQLPKKKKKRIGFWWFLIPTIAAVGASVLLMYNFNNGNIEGSTKQFYAKNDQSSNNNQIVKEDKDINNVIEKTTNVENKINTYRLKDGKNSDEASLNITGTDQSEDIVEENYSSPISNLPRSKSSGLAKNRLHSAEGNAKPASKSDSGVNKADISKDEKVATSYNEVSANIEAVQEITESDKTIQNLPENNIGSDSNITSIKDFQNNDSSSEEPIVRIESKRKQSKNWYIEANFSVYNTLAKENGLLKINREFNNPLFRSKFVSDEVETNIHSGFSMGVVVKKELGRFKLGTGFNYSHLYEKINIGGRDSTILTSIINRLNSNGTGLYQDTVYQVVTGNRKISAENASNIYSVPVFAEYALMSKGRWHFSLNGGLYFNYMVYKNSLTGEVHSIFPGGTRLLNNAKGMGLDGHLGFRVNYNLMQRVGLYIEPNIRMNLVQMKDGVFINTKSLDRIGIMFGTSIRLNKK